MVRTGPAELNRRIASTAIAMGWEWHAYGSGFTRCREVKHLLENPRWIRAQDICVRFEICQRKLRALGDRPGLCSEFAISGDKGFKHVRHATTVEFNRSYQRSRTHGINELIGARRRKRYRDRLLTSKPPPMHERATGQAVML